MKIMVYIISGFIFFSCTSKKENFGKIRIVEDFYPIYENDDSYIPHDYFEEVDLQRYIGWPDTLLALSLKRTNNHLIITNKGHGHTIIFTISKNLDILNVEYRGYDVFQEGESKSTVEKVIFYVNTNPFECSHIKGYYTLQIRDDIFFADKIRYDDRDTTMFYVYNGKFKFYSEEEKKNGRDWVISQNEIMLGIKDSLDVFYSPDKFPEFALGDDALDQILKQFEIKRSETTIETRKFVEVRMVIDVTGKVIPESMTLEDMKSDELILKIKNCKPLLSNWKPAIYKDKPVKSKVNIPIKIKD